MPSYIASFTTKIRDEYKSLCISKFDSHFEWSETIKNKGPPNSIDSMQHIDIFLITRISVNTDDFKTKTYYILGFFEYNSIAKERKNESSLEWMNCVEKLLGACLWFLLLRILIPYMVCLSVSSSAVLLFVSIHTFIVKKTVVNIYMAIRLRSIILKQIK